MSRATRNLVNAAIHISNLQENYLRDVLQNLLASNPSIVLNALEAKGFSFEKAEKKTLTELLERKSAPYTYKIVLMEYGGRMSLIKFVRETLGVGLGEAKAWTEGVALNRNVYMETLPSGVFYQGLTYEDANHRVENMREQIARRGYNIQIDILRDSESYAKIPPKEL